MEEETGKTFQEWLKRGAPLRLPAMPRNILFTWPQTKEVKEEVSTT